MKDLTFRRVHEKPNKEGDCLRGGKLGQFADLRRAWQERGGGGIFEGAVDTPMHTMYTLLLIVLIIKWLFRISVVSAFFDSFKQVCVQCSRYLVDTEMRAKYS